MWEQSPKHLKDDDVIITLSSTTEGSEDDLEKMDSDDVR